MASYNTDQFGIDKLTAEVANLRRDLQQLRTLQLNSANGLAIVGYPEEPSAIDDVLAPGGLLTYNYQVFPEGEILTQWDLFFTVYVDLPSYPTLDLSHRYQFLKSKIRVSQWPDWARSSDSTGHRWFNVNVENYDSVSHHIYVVGKFYGPYALQPSSEEA